MATFDVRADKENIDTILFGSEEMSICKDGNAVSIYDGGNSGNSCYISNEDVLNLIKALDKANNLGWFKSSKKAR